MRLFDYGCGQEGKYKQTSGKWCCSKYFTSCPEIRRRNSETNKIKQAGDNNGMYGKKHSIETKRKIGEKSKDKFFSKEYRDKLSKALIGNTRRLGIKHTEETKKKLSKKLKGRKLTEKNRLGISKALKGRIFTEEWKKKLSDTRKRLFKDDEFLKEFRKNLQQKPTNIEIIIREIVEQYGYEYTGNFKVWIDGKNPDFVNIKSKKVIEVFGDYWHKKEDEYKRYLHFKKNNYKILIIWEHDIVNNINLVKKRFFKFHYKE